MPNVSLFVVTGAAWGFEGFPGPGQGKRLAAEELVGFLSATVSVTPLLSDHRLLDHS